MALDTAAGRLIGVDKGEFGGGLRFRPLSGKEVELSEDNVTAILPIPDGAIVFFGLAHLSLNRGHAMRLREHEGVWSLSFIDALPGRPDAVLDLTYGVFAVRIRQPDNNDGRVILLNKDYVIGEARCVR